MERPSQTVGLDAWRAGGEDLTDFAQVVLTFIPLVAGFPVMLAISALITAVLLGVYGCEMRELWKERDNTWIIFLGALIFPLIHVVISRPPTYIHAIF